VVKLPGSNPGQHPAQGGGVVEVSAVEKELFVVDDRVGIKVRQAARLQATGAADGALHPALQE